MRTPIQVDAVTHASTFHYSTPVASVWASLCDRQVHEIRAHAGELLIAFAYRSPAGNFIFEAATDYMCVGGDVPENEVNRLWQDFLLRAWRAGAGGDPCGD